MKKHLTIQALPNRLQQRGVSEKILLHPAIAFDYLPIRLKDWGLI